MVHGLHDRSNYQFCFNSPFGGGSGQFITHALNPELSGEIAEKVNGGAFNS